ncbi:MAG: hypothetical protein H0T47_16010 [Planctomycetaceae bacterium]|nr:hypothetical protein [Planctomycetaceae bacterium]
MRRICRSGVLLCGLAAGCALRPDTAAIENELRVHEDRILTLEQRLQQAQDELAAARRESDHLREQVRSTGEQVLASEQADSLFRAEGLRINTLLTGGLDEDGRPGDEVLSLVVEPFDADRQPIKLPGELTIDVTDPAAAGEDAVVGRWTYSAEEVRKAWHSGLLITGFKFRLPWQSTPIHETLVVHTRLATSDGRVFDATETVKIEAPAGDGTLAASKPFER